MYLLKAGRFHINLAYTQFIHEEREDLFSISAKAPTSVARNSPDGELLQRFITSCLWVDPASAPSGDYHSESQSRRSVSAPLEMPA